MGDTHPKKTERTKKTKGNGRVRVGVRARVTGWVVTVRATVRVTVRVTVSSVGGL